MNTYPVIITDQKTEVGYANWGKNAQDRAQDQALQMRAEALRNGEYVYDIIYVIAKSRQEVVKNYEV